MVQTQLPARATGAWAEVRETHIGAVFLVGDLAYKLKKPVDLGFLDFTTREAREKVCHREVLLNSRLAPDVYQGVADVTGPDGTVCDHLVVMRRMPADRALSALVSHRQALTGTIERLAEVLANFHASAKRGPAIDAQGTRDAIQDRWEDSFEQVRPFHGPVLSPGIAAEIEQLTEEFLAGREALFTHRIETGRIVDGHGDLIADDIFCLDDGPRILDCLEFDDNLRAVDGLDDVAFLAMDLERLGAPELGTLLLDRYATLAADPAPQALRHHYIAYRAFVRVKVACLRYAQGDESAAQLARDYADIALKHLRKGAVLLVLIGGLPASGKSTLSDAVADRLGATVLRTDIIRKELADLTPGQNAAAGYEQGLYDPAHSKQTYAELDRRAAELLGVGRSAVLDASWTSGERRRSATDVGSRTHSRVVPLRCWAPEATTDARLAHRTGSLSDATPEVAQRMAMDVLPWPDAHTVMTAGTEAESLTQALAYVAERTEPEWNRTP